MDELHTYVKKNYCWGWIYVDRVGRKFIDSLLGSKGAEPELILFYRVFLYSQTGLHVTDN
jgi:hypothetical protein